MKWNDESYLNAYDHNYRVAYEEGLSHIGEGGSPQKGLDKLKALLLKTGFPSKNTKLLDLGCGDGTNGLFLSQLGYDYTGVDISEAAIKRAQERATESNLEVHFQVGNALDLPLLQDKSFSIVLDSYCFHMLVTDPHRKTYFDNVKRVLSDNGMLLILAQHDDAAYEGPIASFEDFCKLTGTKTSGIPFQKCVGDQWVNVENKRIYLMGRTRNLEGYRQEFKEAGFHIVYHTLWQNRKKAAFLLQNPTSTNKELGQKL